MYNEKKNGMTPVGKKMANECSSVRRKMRIFKDSSSIRLIEALKGE
jgi:hypothetical protein